MYRPIDPQIEQGNCIFFLNFQIIFIQYPRTCQLSPLPSVLQKKHLAETEVLTDKVLEVYVYPFAGLVH